MIRCGYTDDWVELCPQTAWSWTRAKGRCFYHAKLDKGLLDRADRVLSDVELDSLFGGRTRYDGRRLDHYTRQ